MRTALPVLLLSTAALLAACGGASNDGDPPPAPPAAPSGVLPASATSSIQAFIGFLGGLMTPQNELPLDIDAAVPPTSETATPSAVD